MWNLVELQVYVLNDIFYIVSKIRLVKKLLFSWRNVLNALTGWHSDAVSLRIQQTPNLSQFAISLDHVFDGGRFHEKCVAAPALDDLFDPFLVAGSKNGRPLWFHERPHPLVSGEIGILEGINVDLNRTFWSQIIMKYFDDIAKSTEDYNK